MSKELNEKTILVMIQRIKSMKRTKTWTRFKARCYSSQNRRKVDMRRLRRVKNFSSAFACCEKFEDRSGLGGVESAGSEAERVNADRRSEIEKEGRLGMGDGTGSLMVTLSLGRFAAGNEDGGELNLHVVRPIERLSVPLMPMRDERESGREDSMLCLCLNLCVGKVEESVDDVFSEQDEVKLSKLNVARGSLEVRFSDGLSGFRSSG